MDMSHGPDIFKPMHNHKLSSSDTKPSGHIMFDEMHESNVNVEIHPF